MKSTLLISLLSILYLGQVYAQNQKVQSAFIFIKSGELDRALPAIEEAVVNEKTISSAKAWYYRGEIYLAIYGTDNPEFQKLVSADPLLVAMESYRKSKTLDIKDEFGADINKKMKSIIEKLYNRGVDHYNNKEYKYALADFELVLIDNPKDTSVLFNAALTSEKAKEPAKAIQYLDALLKQNYQSPQIYVSLASNNKALGDTVAALNYLIEGQKKYPNEVALIIDELNIFLMQGRATEVIGKLEKAVALDPNNPSLHFALGSALDQIGDKQKAEVCYQRAIDIKPEYFDGWYNLGAMYFNNAAESMNEANRIPFNKKKEYEVAVALAKEAFVKARPFLEKAHELDPKDNNTMVSLQQLYAQLKLNDKSMEMKKKREALAGK
ncbi:MAG: tetratricopeptide repeat protein [Sphingomonadales bacterium]|nr:tetratricopeptide repeat protein [Sphingomonadales bacterium]